MSDALDAVLATPVLRVVRSVLDVLIVYYIVYRALLVLKGTRAMQIGIGLAVVFLLYVVARVIELTTLQTLLGTLISSGLLILVVIFQADIRRGLMRLGSKATLGRARAQETRVIDAVVEAATDLARHRMGGLIAFEQEANLDEFVGVHEGEVIDAEVSRHLLVSLFVPEATNKLHDGAVIIRNLRIARAGVFFPMTSRSVDATFGSRHRAALGITEETDAVVVVVSEERGNISFCFNGNIVTGLDGQNLRASLLGVFAPGPGKKARTVLRAKPQHAGTRFEETQLGLGALVTETAPDSELGRETLVKPFVPTAAALGEGQAEVEPPASRRPASPQGGPEVELSRLAQAGREGREADEPPEPLRKRSGKAPGDAEAAERDGELEATERPEPPSLRARPMAKPEGALEKKPEPLRRAKTPAARDEASEAIEAGEAAPGTAMPTLPPPPAELDVPAFPHSPACPVPVPLVPAGLAPRERNADPSDEEERR